MSRMNQRRAHDRRQALVDCTLSRRRGGPVYGCTLDVGGGGMRVTTDRPLAVDEVLDFDLPLTDEQRVAGHARVLREQGQNVYALRFEDLPDEALQALANWVFTG